MFTLYELCGTHHGELRPRVAPESPRSPQQALHSHFLTSEFTWPDSLVGSLPFQDGLGLGDKGCVHIYMGPSKFVFIFSGNADALKQTKSHIA